MREVTALTNGEIRWTKRDSNGC